MNLTKCVATLLFTRQISKLIGNSDRLMRLRAVGTTGATKLWIVAGLIVILIVTVVIVVLHRQKMRELRQWCHDHGYNYYVTRDYYCVDQTGELRPARPE
jgi:hypothetical protein